MTPQEYEALVRQEMIRRGIFVPEANNAGWNANAAASYPDQSQAPGGLGNIAGPAIQGGIFRGTQSLFGPSSELGTEEAANVAWNAPASTATNTANEAALAPGLGIGPYLGVGAAGLGAYGLYDALRHKNVKSGALSGAALGGGLAAAAPLVGLGPVGWAGLGLAAALGAGGGAGLTSLFGHKSTKQVIGERTNKLLGSMKGHEDIVTALRSAAHDGADNAEWKRTATERMRDPIGMWGTYGMLKTFGNDYFDKMNEAQRFAATKYAIDNNLLKGNKGDIIVSDEDKLRNALDEFTNNKGYQEAYNTWKKGGPSIAPIKPIVPGASIDPGFHLGGSPAAAVAAIAKSVGVAPPGRTNTLSPGIDLQGHKIKY